MIFPNNFFTRFIYRNINLAVRKGDIYGFMIEHFVKVQNYKQAYALIMEIPNVNLGSDLCLKFSLNPLRFSQTRETDTKMIRVKS